LLFVCSPTGQEEFFQKVGMPVAPMPKLDGTAQAEFEAKAVALAPKYRTEFLEYAGREVKLGLHSEVNSSLPSGPTLVVRTEVEGLAHSFPYRPLSARELV
jgi:hypothetical protein